MPIILHDKSHRGQARILRVPFRNASGEVVPQWISRSEVWPYLERYAVDVERELLAELGGRPDLIIGNYSDLVQARETIPDRKESAATAILSAGARLPGASRYFSTRTFGREHLTADIAW